MTLHDAHHAQDFREHRRADICGCGTEWREETGGQYGTWAVGCGVIDDNTTAMRGAHPVVPR